MMQEENTTTSAEPAVVSDEKKEETPAETASSSLSSLTNTNNSSSEPSSIADRLDKTKEIMKDFGKTVAIEKPKQMLADIQDLASNFKEKVAKLSPNNNDNNFGETTTTNNNNGEPVEKVDPMEKPRQFFNDMKEKATSFKGFSLNPPPPGGNTPEHADLDVTLDETTPAAVPKNDALLVERSKEFFTGMKEKASSFKIKIGEEKLDEDGNPIPGPLDRMKEDMKGLASGIREKMPPLGGEEKLDEDGNPVPGPLDRMKADMKGLASGIREKMPPLGGEEKLDEDGNPVPGPLDRMKADMKGLASGIREKMATNTTSRASTATGNTEGNSAVFTISEDEDEEGARISAEQPKHGSNDLSLKFNDLVQSARTTANDSLTSMPSLRSFYHSSESSFPKFGEKFSSFRHSTIDPISEKFGMKKEESSLEGGVEEISFGAEPTMVDFGTEPTVVKELGPDNIMATSVPPPATTTTESTSVTVSEDYV